MGWFSEKEKSVNNRDWIKPGAIGYLPEVGEGSSFAALINPDRIPETPEGIDNAVVIVGSGDNLGYWRLKTTSFGGLACPSFPTPITDKTEIYQHWRDAVLACATKSRARATNLVALAERLEWFCEEQGDEEHER